MKQKSIIIASLVIALVLLGGIGVFFATVWPGLKPVVLPPVSGDPDVTNADVTSTPTGYYVDGAYTLPLGFSIAVLTDDVPEARDLIVGPRGELIVSQTDEGIVSFVDRETGSVTPIINGLNNPHGLALNPKNEFELYIAEEDVISKVILYSEEESYEEVVSLPEGGRHYTRSIGFGPDGALYVSIGSTCDVCQEQNSLHGTIQRVNLETRELEPYATGLRNAVFFTWHDIDGSMWATEMGRDMLGDNLPPDEINKIEGGNWYGWPWYYGANVFDENFANGRMPSFATEAISATVELPAHVAPLGIDTIPEEGWPEEYWYDFVVAYHGSWNRSEPVGYKVVRHMFDAEMNYLGAEDFITGWLTENNRAIGRPVDVLALPGGILYISDDSSGTIYEVTYNTTDDNTTAPVTFTNIPKGNVIPAEFTLKGSAIGPWYFEASFSVDVLDTQGNTITTEIVQAQGEWMTTEMVPFEVRFDLEEYIGEELTLVFQKANPSGLPEFHEEIHIPVTILSNTQARAFDGCVISGCSNEVCGEESVSTICIYKPEFACYESATCERQSDGACGWTKTEELTTCLEQQV